MRKPHLTDLSDAKWVLLHPLIPPANSGEAPRTVDLRDVLNTLFYQARTGCQWDMLPHCLLPRSTAFDYLQRWQEDGPWQRLVDALRHEARTQAGWGHGFLVARVSAALRCFFGDSIPVPPLSRYRSRPPHATAEVSAPTLTSRDERRDGAQGRRGRGLIQ